MKTKKARIALIAAAAVCAAALAYVGWNWRADNPPSNFEIGFEIAKQVPNEQKEDVFYDGTNADKDPFVTEAQLIDALLQKVREVSREKNGNEELPPDLVEFIEKFGSEAYQKHIHEHGHPLRLSKLDVHASVSDAESYEGAHLESLGYYDGPQTVEAVMEEFDKYNPHLSRSDDIYPRKEWVQRALDLGVQFLDNMDYSSIFHLRDHLVSVRKNPEKHAVSIKMNGLHNDEDFDAYIDREMVEIAKDNELLREATRKDPQGDGFIRLPDRYIMTRKNQVHVKITPGDPSHSVLMYGPRERKLTAKERRALTYHGIAPKGIEVIYLDENNEPLPAGSDPITLKWGDKVSAMSDAQREAALHKAADFLGSDRADEMTALEWKTLADYTGALLDYKPPAPENAAPPSTPKMPAAPNNPAAPAERTDPAPSPNAPEAPSESAQTAVAEAAEVQREELDAFFEYLDRQLIENADLPEPVRRALRERHDAYLLWRKQDRLRRQESQEESGASDENR